MRATEELNTEELSRRKHPHGNVIRASEGLKGTQEVGGWEKSESRITGMKGIKEIERKARQKLLPSRTAVRLALVTRSLW
jgi:hypothetical protein